MYCLNIPIVSMAFLAAVAAAVPVMSGLTAKRDGYPLSVEKRQGIFSAGNMNSWLEANERRDIHEKRDPINPTIEHMLEQIE
ncbi:hypothetical protein BT63DRAFT_475744 [Microthyrium microscopicum]|uniref:Uncharacterized protein n=1 Tax=Microthyrium microscopicum TaxID=703497 RepID=A0A6A6UN41_9PEZI|nr:hypothetical protein BT63DRAFT_475744 [Microthyrium microscopicum]